MALMRHSKWEEGAFNQYIAATMGSMGFTIVGASTSWPSPTLTKMERNETPLVLDPTQISWMVSLMFLGHMLSPVPTGYLMDIFGRKRTCLFLSILPCTSWLLIFLAESPVHLYIARFAAGLWIGVTSTIIPVYVGEIASTKLRSSLITINNGLYNFGILFAYVIGPYVSYYMLAIACEILTVIYIISFIPMPESPYYLIKQKKREEAFKVLSWLHKGKSRENIENEINRIEHATEDQKLERGALKKIFFDAGNRKAFIISVSYATLKRLSGSGVMQAYVSITLPKVTFGVLDPDTCVIIVGFISFLASIVSTALSVKYRRHILMTISCGGCALTTGLIALWLYLNYYTSVPVTKYSDIIFVSFVFYYVVFDMGLGPIGTSIKGELFSTNVKALSSSLITIIIAIFAFFLNKFYLIVAQAEGMYVNYVIYSISCITAVIFTWTYVPEMHNKTLEEIREMLSRKSRPVG